MKQTAILCFALTLSMSASAQFRILSNGHIVAGVDPKFSSPLIMGGLQSPADPQAIVSVDNTLQPDTTCAMTIGSTSYFHTGGYLAFGRKGNVRIGELAGKTDNILHLHSANAIQYTSPSGPIFSYTHSTSTQNSFAFTVPVSATKYLTLSDSRLKSDVRNLEGAGERLFELTPVSYRLATGPQTMGEIDGKLSEEAISDAVAQESLSVPEYGFMAQEVREIFPDLVTEREDGVLMVDYQGMIPLLVDAVSTLRRQVRTQQETIDRLTGDVVVKRQNAPAKNALGLLTENTLGQNRPNPTTGATVIDLSLESCVGEAFVAFYDLTGQQLRRYDISERGVCQLSIGAGEFTPGVYLYILVADGQEVQSRRMIVSE